MPRAAKKTGSYIAGERGRNRVRLFSRLASEKLYLEWTDPTGRKKRQGLGHSNWNEGKFAADERALALARRDPIGQITLGSLFDIYESEVTPHKAESTRRHDKAALELFRRAWGSARQADSLNRSDWDTFIRLRRSGKLRPAGRTRSGPVKNRIIEQDLRLLLAVLNWATTSRFSGSPLLSNNPLRLLEVPTEKNVVRPVMSDPEYRQILEKSAEIHPMFRAFLIVVHETGHRSKSVRLMKWTNVDLQSGIIRWQAEDDKIQFEHSTPLTPAAIEGLEHWRRVNAGMGLAMDYVFPSPSNPKVAAARELLLDWLQEAESLAGVAHVHGRGFHSLRRKFATERRHFPPRELQDLGGWKDFNTLNKCYQLPNMEALRAALDRPLLRVS